MEVLLRKDIDRLGKRGEVVNVAAGYARNFLMPQKLATQATEENKRIIMVQRQAEERQRQEQIQQLAGLKGQIESTSCMVAAPASPEGHLFGSVGPAEIAKAFKADGLPIEPEMVKMENPIKEIGVFTVAVQVTGDLRATTRVWVTAQ